MSVEFMQGSSSRMSYAPSFSIDAATEFLPPQDLQPHAPSIDQDPDIAPWLSEPPREVETFEPPQTQKPAASRAFKSSFSFASTQPLGRAKTNEAHSLRSRPSDTSSLVNWGLDTTSTDSHSPESPRNGQDVKKKPSFLKSVIKRARSSSRLSGASSSRLDLTSAHEYPVPPLPSPDMLPSFHPPSPPASSHSLKFRGRKALKKKGSEAFSPVSGKDGIEYHLDRNIDNMDGIVDLTILPDLNPTPTNGDPSSPKSGFGTSTDSSALSSDVSSVTHYNSTLSSSPPGGPTFTYPFQSSKGTLKRKQGPNGHHFDRKISPKTPAPVPQGAPPAGQEASWTAPESWEVEKGDELVVESGSDVDDHVYPRSSSGRPQRKKTKRATMSMDGRYKIRIYRANNTYHLANLSLSDTVQDMIPILNEKLLLDPDRETHRLYLKERGRERMLGMTEKPASIVRRQLQQAGYEDVDDIQEQEDIQFLMKFVYKSNVIGAVDENLHLDNYELVDLTARALRTIPVLCHKHADEIVFLNLSRNPMVEIPLDFIQSCNALRELRLQNMAMKTVPRSVRHATTLNRLDLSCNRITNLNDAALDSIPLKSLKLQNNGMEELPWYFPRLRCLQELNISNNKFRQVPEVVCKIPGLIDLDISFNMISELPNDVGNLKLLEKLIIVGNQVSKFPITCSSWINLRDLDCRRNNISDLSLVSTLPKVEKILADHNVIHSLNLSFGPELHELDASHNDITLLTAPPGSDQFFFSMTTLDISHAKLSTLDNLGLGQLASLQELKVDHNSIRSLPESVGDLSQLRLLSCSNNQLYALPASIGRLQKLETLEAHNNSIEELPASIWDCASLSVINVTSNLIKTLSEAKLRDETMTTLMTTSSSSSPPLLSSVYMERKASAASSVGLRPPCPPLAISLRKLFLGENMLSEEHLHLLMVLNKLKVLNLSFNRIQLIPPVFLRNLPDLEELYLSGNELAALPNAELEALVNLRVLFLNGNKLQSLPQELGKIQSLTVLDVGSNLLRYNINNWEFDWNWNFNQNLRYLNLSGNKRLEIKPDHKAGPSHTPLDDFSMLKDLKVLGLMDVTTTFAPNIPDDTEDRRVRTSLSEVCNMAYGIADTLGQSLTMFDFVQPEFRERKTEAIFGMFGRPSHIGSNNRISKFLQANVTSFLAEEVDRVERYRNGTVNDAMRRTFLKLNKGLHDFLYSRDPRRPSSASSSINGPPGVDYTSFKSGACGVLLYFMEKTLYVAHAGSALAVMSRQGNAEVLTKMHDPFDRSETTRIRSAEGWVSPKGLVNDEVDASRSFGFYYLLPVICARPDVLVRSLDELDEFVIIGNRGLWDFVSYQTAVDIVRKMPDPMLAAQKLRDFAMSYGAEGTTMIMVINVGDLFDSGRSRKHTLDPVVDDAYLTWLRNKKDDISNRDIYRLGVEVPAPTGHIALVFTDIRNSTHLWEANQGMQTAIFLHNSLLRRHLRLCGGYEVKTEGDAFVCAFPDTLTAVWWTLIVQVQLLQVAWPLEILECEDGKETYDDKGRLVARGLSVRMGIHCGRPIPDPDPTTRRMDYLGPVVNRAARISGSAAGGQIMCSADVIREINATVFETDPPTEHSRLQSPQAVEAIRRLGVEIFPYGEVKLKGLEVPESLSLIYSTELAGRHGLENLSGESASGSRVQFSVEQMRELAMLCLRLEALTSSRVFRPLPVRKSSAAAAAAKAEVVVVEEQQRREVVNSVYLYGNPDVLLPNMGNASDAELTLLLDSLSCRIENSLAALTMRQIMSLNKGDRGDVHARRSGTAFDVRVLQQLMSLLPSL